MAKIRAILDESVIEKEVKVGEEVVSFNGHPFEDVLDYIYADSSDKCVIEVVNEKGEKREVYAVKQSDCYTLGLEFDESVEITPRECHNNCIFCFVRQLPKNLRETLYIRDDDYRLSFISGSYITCTNLQEKDILRIIEYRLSPLYVSVHATDPEVHKYLLGIKKCPDQMQILKRLIDNGIKIHAQIVMVGGINDGEILQKSISELYGIGVSTLAIVPVGLTSHREGLTTIEPLTINQASNAIDIAEAFYTDHPNFCYCSDEMYQIARRDVKDAGYYGEYEQIENGVGLISKFLSELGDALDYAPKKCHRKVGVFTGISGVSTMEKAKTMLQQKYKKLELNIYPVKNTFFGETVTVTGLITATDIIKSYGTTKFYEEFLIIPQVMLKEFETVFLDNTTVDALSKTLKKKIVVSASTGESFLETIIYGDKKI